MQAKREKKSRSAQHVLQYNKYILSHLSRQVFSSVLTTFFSDNNIWYFQGEPAHNTLNVLRIIITIPLSEIIMYTEMYTDEKRR